MEKIYKVMALLLVLAVVAGCTAAPAETEVPPALTETTEPAEAALAEPTSAPTEELPNLPLYVNLTWHQHQPLYYKDEDGIYTRPWVRVHATKDYLDMAELVAQHEGMKATFNLTPVLLRQLIDFTENGAKDLYWVLAEKPAAELTDEEKTFILTRFFDANWDHIIRVYPRYAELLDLRDGTDEAAIQDAVTTFTEQDFRDLQIWFNLAWVDPDYLLEEPFKPLVEKGRDFTEEDKTVLFDAILELMRKVISTHKALQDAGIIEVTTTPYAHPILPLIYNTDLALVGNPKAIMPVETFSHTDDAEYHLAQSVEIYEGLFGTRVRGLWPGEGAVAEEIVSMVSEAGYTWMQTGEPVLVASLGLAGDRFPRDGSDTVIDADTFYRPYYVHGETGDQVAVFFRDWVISDKIGFTYSGMSGEDAAADMVGRLEAIQQSLAASDEPHIVTLVVDGENAWENYDNDGKEFFHALYDSLANSDTLIPITPSEYLERFPEQRELPDLFPGAWFSANYDTWIGEVEEAEAWNLLNRVRADLAEWEGPAVTVDAERLAEARDFMYLAEGSDWFWWYGTDQDSGQDSYFDEGYRALLKGVYTSLGLEPPAFLDIPIVLPAAAAANQGLLGSGTPTIDGLDEEAWGMAGYYEGRRNAPVDQFYFLFDDDHLYLRFDVPEEQTPYAYDIYLGITGSPDRLMSAISGETLPIPAALALRLNAGQAPVVYEVVEGAWQPVEVDRTEAAYADGILEASLPLETLGELNTGDVLPVVILSKGAMFPADKTAGEIRYMKFGPQSSLLLVEDPEGDDFGPGSYTYPSDGVFHAGDFDLVAFEVTTDENNLNFYFTVRTPITNGWNSPLGFSVQTFDVYIDKDPGAGTGDRLLLPGRNAAFEAGNGWDIAVWIEGWNSQVVIPDPVSENKPVNFTEATSAMRIYLDAGRNAVVASVPLEFFGEGDPATWGYAAVLLGQEGYPTDGVWRVRDVSTKSEAYRFGGAPLDSNHTRIIDVALPANFAVTQQDILGTYNSSVQPLESLTPDDFAQVPLVMAE